MLYEMDIEQQCGAQMKKTGDYKPYNPISFAHKQKHNGTYLKNDYSIIHNFKQQCGKIKNPIGKKLGAAKIEIATIKPV